MFMYTDKNIYTSVELDFRPWKSTSDVVVEFLIISSFFH